MKGITKKNLENLSKEELIAVCLELADTSNIKVTGLKGYARQVREMADFLNKAELVKNIEDAKDKTWDRGHKIMDNFESYLTKLGEMEEKFLPAKNDNKLREEASSRSVLNFGK